MDLANDYGPSVVRKPDGRMVSFGPGRVVIEDREDVGADANRAGNRPLVRGARRQNALQEAYDRGAITKRHRDAAERFLDDCSIASGASGSGLSGALGGGGRRGSLPERQVMAIGRVNQVALLLGLNSGTVFWWVVFWDRPVRQFEAHYRVRHGQGAAWLREALEALDEHYDRPVVGPGGAARA